MAGVGLLRLLVKKAGGQTVDDEPAPPPLPRTAPPFPRAPTQTDEERIRKFLEALGQPTTSAPPPPVSPRPLPPAITEFQRAKMEEAARAARRRSIMTPLPPLTTVPPEPSSRRVIMPRGVQLPGQITRPPVRSKDVHTSATAARRLSGAGEYNRAATTSTADHDPEEAYTAVTQKADAPAGNQSKPADRSPAIT